MSFFNFLSFNQLNEKSFNFRDDNFDFREEKKFGCYFKMGSPTIISTSFDYFFNKHFNIETNLSLSMLILGQSLNGGISAYCYPFKNEMKRSFYPYFGVNVSSFNFNVTLNSPSSSYILSHIGRSLYFPIGFQKNIGKTLYLKYDLGYTWIFHEGDGTLDLKSFYLIYTSYSIGFRF